jgi:predicted TIM-barrel fold metal-dependent hydrolase
MDAPVTEIGIIDAHAHIFRPAAVFPRGVDQLAPAERDAPVEDLLELMARNGVDAAVLVPLDAHDDYVAQVLAEYPKTFAAIAVATSAELGVGGAAACRACGLAGITSASTACAPSGWANPASP